MNAKQSTTLRLFSASALVVVLGTAEARAQSPAAPAPPDENPPYWEVIGGYEGDTHGTGYGFFGPRYNRPISDSVALSFRVYGTDLRYEFENELGGTTKVHSPGVSPAVGVRFGRRTTLHLSAGLSAKHEDREVRDAAGRVVSERDRWRSGLSLGAELYWNMTNRTNLHAITAFSSQDEYLWSRVGVKRQVSNFDWSGGQTFYLGAEGIVQGNDDIFSTQVGALAEVLFNRSRLSLMVRGGYKRSTFDRGDDKDGPYFGVGLYKRF